ncbi:hypothetical protein BD560DRAFT_408082 [Blakeslea trispora]|nr:hypothetical protein BD560DRAFT_408082 [Blakeslea trispora]
MTIPKQQDTRSPIPPSMQSYNHHLGIATLNSSRERSLPTLTSLRSPYSPSSASPVKIPNYHNTSSPDKPTLMSPTPSPSTTNLLNKHIPQSPADPSLSNHNAYRPLNVTDALAYLDLVKNRFSDKPDVYNQFLDIMKDFKSQAIDTPGVIKRVSSLFKGHPELISGFNTFLPSGYRIQCSTDPRDPHTIIVITPTETMTIHNNHPTQEPTLLSTPSLPPTTPLSSSNAPFHAPRNTPANQTASPVQHTTAPVNEKRPPIEFNHAINYVNRIKNRFAYHPDIYKQFLEILQTYQKEQKPIGEVYAHVRYLFQDAEDLLDEFKQFLPEIMEEGKQTHPPHGLKRSHTTPPTLPAKKKRAYVTKKSKALLTEDAESSIDRKSSRSTHPDEILTSFDPHHPTVSSSEISLFDKIKKHIGNKPSYDEFLKLLNLYTQQIVDMDLLVIQVKRFIGQDKDLFQAFKIMIGYDPKEAPIERPTLSVAKPDLNQCKTIKSSPSYRAAPRDWQNLACSGRDQMCWEVLNDEYISYPIWASEDSFVITSKRNLHEEALHRCEEERYDYDVNIEANHSAIALLKPIALQMEQMSPEEKRAMRLEPGLGGPTVSIYERMIKKVYDDERGHEIIQMLYQSPASVVPVLLNRLQLKDQEWKRAQREWNKVWRDQDDKNFYKSLDYQANSFKANDKKALAQKALVAEIENTASRQISVVFEQVPVEHVFDLMDSFLDRQHGFSAEDRQKTKQGIQALNALLFGSSAETSPTLKSLSPVESKEKLDLFATAAAFTAPRQEDLLFDKRFGIPFFCNSNYYCLVRLYQVLFERLYRFKSLSDRIKDNPLLGKKHNKIAKELDLISTRFDDIDLSKGYYEAAIELMDRFFKGDCDQNTFEENLRYLFGIDAYIMFTIDKLLQALIKQIQIVSMDKKSIQLLKFYQEYKHKSDSVAIADYHEHVTDLLGTDDMYQMDLDQETQKVTIHLLDNEDLQTADEKGPEQRAYKEYLTSYIDWMNTTKGIDTSCLKPTFLNRTLRPNHHHFKYACIRSQLRYKIQEKTYHMYYIVHSEDILYRKPRITQEDKSDGWYAWLASKGNDVLSAETKALLE